MKIKIPYLFLLCLTMGILMGKFMLQEYATSEKENKVVKLANNVYFVEIGTYSSLEEMEQKVTNVEYYIYTEKEGKYYAYVGMTLKEENITKLQSYFSNNGYNTTIKSFTIDSKAFLEVLQQYDLMLENTEDANTISAICSQVLSKYEEIVLSDQN